MKPINPIHLEDAITIRAIDQMLHWRALEAAARESPWDDDDRCAKLADSIGWVVVNLQDTVIRSILIRDRGLSNDSLEAMRTPRASGVRLGGTLYLVVPGLPSYDALADSLGRKAKLVITRAGKELDGALPGITIYDLTTASKGGKPDANP